MIIPTGIKIITERAAEMILLTTTEELLTPNLSVIIILATDTSQSLIPLEQVATVKGTDQLVTALFSRAEVLRVIPADAEEDPTDLNQNLHLFHQRPIQIY